MTFQDEICCLEADARARSFVGCLRADERWAGHPLVTRSLSFCYVLRFVSFHCIKKSCNVMVRCDLI